MVVSAPAQLAYVSSFITKTFGAAKPRRCSAYRSSRFSWSKKWASHNQSLCQGTKVSAMAPQVTPWGYLHTYSLQSIQWRWSRRRIEPIPLRPGQVSSIARGDLLDALLDAWLCCSKLSFGDYIFNVASAVSVGTSCMSVSTHSLCICPHMSPSVTPASLRTVVHHGERSVIR
jgi:hypothetical protein